MSKYFSIIIGIIIIGYSIFNFRIFIAGPSITITSIENGLAVSDSLLNIQGVAKNTSFIDFNNRPILIDSNGNFEESVILYPGYNSLLFHAKDQFGREINEKLELVFQGELEKAKNSSENEEESSFEEENQGENEGNFL